MFERFTELARRALVLAQEEARLLDHNFIGTEHILLGLLHEGEGIAADALGSLGVSLDAAREKVADTIGPSGLAPAGSPPFTPRAKKVLELSLREALQLRHDYIGPEHLLLGVVREGEGVAAQALVSLGVDLNRVRERVLELVGVETTTETAKEAARGEPSGPGSGSPVAGQRPLIRPSRREGAAADGPVCPACGAGLAVEAVWTSLSVPPAGGGGAPRSFTVVYCRACGTSVASLPAAGSP